MEQSLDRIAPIMAIHIELPPAIEQKLRALAGDPGAIGREAMLVELYRQGAVSHEESPEGLGISRLGVDAILRQHGVTEDLMTAEEHAAQVAGLRKRIGG